MPVGVTCQSSLFANKKINRDALYNVADLFSHSNHKPAKWIKLWLRAYESGNQALQLKP